MINENHSLPFTFGGLNLNMNSITPNKQSSFNESFDNQYTLQLNLSQGVNKTPNLICPEIAKEDKELDQTIEL